MYLPRANHETDLETLHTFIRQHSFATLVTNDADNIPFATHLPVLLDVDRGEHGTLVAHLARANPQWRQFSEEQEVLFLFQGAHAYVSPSWYESEFSVPTWNYAVVHAYGRPKVIEDRTRLQEMLTELVSTFEEPMEQPWRTDWTDDRNKPLLKAIVGINVEITRVEGKFKLSQNKPMPDQAGVIKGLQNSTSQAEREIADMMRKRVAGSKQYISRPMSAATNAKS